MHYDSYMSEIVILVYLVVHPYALGLVVIVCYLCFATIDPPSEFEEGCEGETFAGEAEEEPGTTGKPPLALACFFTYNCLHMLWFQKLHYSNDAVASGTPAFYITTPVGAGLE